MTATRQAAARRPDSPRPIASTRVPVKAPALPRRPLSTSRNLPCGAQAKLVCAALFAEAIGRPLNALATINIEAIGRGPHPGLHRRRTRHAAREAFTERARHWMTERDLPWVAIWAREASTAEGEHLHLALHLPPDLRDPFADQLADWWGVPRAEAGPGTAAVSEGGLWHLACRRPRGGGAALLAAYLAKAEQRTRRRYGRAIANENRLTDRHGGSGEIAGKRFGISHALGPAAQRQAGFEPPALPRLKALCARR